jgi:glycerol-3-phosphate cytidylyltransferase
MKKFIVIGGASGIGREFVDNLAKENKVVVLDISKNAFTSENISYFYFDMYTSDFSIFDSFRDIDGLIITAGVGRLAPFETFLNLEIEKTIGINLTKTISIIKLYYDLIISERDFYCLIMGSISGYVSSPLFSVYAASKSGLVRFVESINSELIYKKRKNRVLTVSPGSLEGTSFYGGDSVGGTNSHIVREALFKMYNRECIYIPKYEEIYHKVIEEYHNDPIQFGNDSYEYKMNSNRISVRPKITIGYLSGTFDLFHIGHLNILKNAKKRCDYLIVGVHKDGSHKGKKSYIPFEERVEILKSIRYVDKVIPSMKEDSDVYLEHKYDKLFVGSDYKGTERFLRYEEFFKHKNVEICYLPYTQSTSSSQIRSYIDKITSN